MAADFHAMIDNWHAVQPPFDDDLNALILRQQVDMFEKPTDFSFMKVPYFSPSSVGGCPRENYMRLKKAKKDVQDDLPFRGRWRRMGEKFGEMLQTDLLFIEKHYEKKLGEPPAFVPERTDEGYPAWEDFVGKLAKIEHNGTDVYLNGKPDGILRHVPTDQRVGLEIKTKQSTAAMTGHYKMSGPDDKHVQQCTVYALMYDLSQFLLVYGNLSKKSFMMTQEDYEANPDLRVFHIEITDEMKTELLDELADIVRKVESGTPPALSLEGWLFNNFKTACAESLTADELEEIRSKVAKVRKSGIPEWKKRNYTDALADIERLRGEEEAE
ncbi:hypothetical protein [Salibacterium aidingense]|uniref:hypothetical protein n=1 Tax=Salibacterium aidingense TaxID=384933 RepID=UPI003BEA13A7